MQLSASPDCWLTVGRPLMTFQLVRTTSLEPDMRTLGFFFFNDTATTEIYTLSLHDALPISVSTRASRSARPSTPAATHSASTRRWRSKESRDRKSTRLNSSHSQISYAVFCLKKKIKTKSKTLQP